MKNLPLCYALLEVKTNEFRNHPILALAVAILLTLLL